jgi:Protein of unknown function (DUF3071)
MSAQELPATVAPGTSPESTSRPAPSDARPQRPAIAHLRLRGLTDDGTRLLLVDDAGLEFTVDVDARLRAALHGDPSRTETSSPSASTRAGHMEKTMESILRPRDIQARIRAGETPEAVAEAAQTTLEKVMPYAAPVLAEREHVAQRALRASIRRPAAHEGPGDRQSPAGTSRTLGEAISGRLRGMNVDPDTVIWDAWRREDGRWSLTASFTAGGHEGLAQLTYDQPGNFVLLDNDEARWLVGDLIETEPAEPEPAPQQTGRLLSAVPSEQLALSPHDLGTDDLGSGDRGSDDLGSDDLGADALALVRDEAPESASTQDLTETAAAIRGLPVEQPIEAFLDSEPGLDESTLVEEAADAAARDTAPAPDPAADEPPARAPSRKKRASVPSWDEIMFGGADKE